MLGHDTRRREQCRISQPTHRANGQRTAIGYREVVSLNIAQQVHFGISQLCAHQFAENSRRNQKVLRNAVVLRCLPGFFQDVIEVADNGLYIRGIGPGADIFMRYLVRVEQALNTYLVVTDVDLSINGRADASCA